MFYDSDMPGSRPADVESGGSWASSDGTAKSMRSNKRRDTGPELAVRRILFANGLRYRVDFAPWVNKRRRADIVFIGPRLAVFIDGCFWHGCPEHATVPVAHADYWAPKLEKNRERDRDTDRMAAGEGWKVLRIWEHVPPEEAAARIMKALRI
ncbi:very short patch repair endonuclease [uncultured Propionibacterium sp.]|uniref:very short patch repair endonuclease n=1 Tax=uncultured Propionibacterium sp. TaxID=218066 RepID=UPI00292CD8E3|nr:very short patch repair endonuclease [uncultured Propionibacterium sp.]